MRGTRAARRGNTVVTEPQRQRIPINGECHGLPDSASASPSSSVSVARDAWLRHQVGLTNCPFTSGLPWPASPAFAGWMQARLGPDLGCMLISHQEFIVNIAKTTTTRLRAITAVSVFLLSPAPSVAVRAVRRTGSHRSAISARKARVDRLTSFQARITSKDHPQAGVHGKGVDSTAYSSVQVVR